MSRFWAAGGSSSESESDDDSDSSSEVSGGGDIRKAETRWADLSDESGSEDEVRVVKSAKDRALEAFALHITNIRAAMKIKDFKTIANEFDDLTKIMIKAKKILALGIPRPLVKLLCNLQDFVTDQIGNKTTFKQLSAGQGRALNRLKLTLKKHNKPYEVVMREYRNNPITDDDDDEEEEDDESSSEEEEEDDDDAKEVSSDEESKDESSSNEEEDSSDKESDDESEEAESSDEGEESSEGKESEWGSDSESSSSEEEEEGAYAQLKGRARWLKKNTVQKKKVVKNKEERAKIRADHKAAVAAKELQEATTHTKSVLPEAILTVATLQRKVKDITSSRGRRGTDNRQLLRQLEGLSRLSLKFGPRVEVPILMHVITAQFDMQRTLDDYMTTKHWKSCASYLSRIESILTDDGYTLGIEEVEDTDLITMQNASGTKMKAAAKAAGGAMAAVAADEKLINPNTGEEETLDERDERVRSEKEAEMTPKELRMIPVVGSLSLHLARLEEEYVKSLQQISPHTSEYVARLRDESILVDLLARAQVYYERENELGQAATLAQLRVEHLYYRHDSIAKYVDRAAKFFQTFGEANMLHPSCITSDDSGKGQTDFTKTHPAAVNGKPFVEEDGSEQVDSQKLISVLCKFVYQHGTDREKTRAMICHIYHHALHDRFLEARDLLLMSHLQDTIANVGDVSTMILFNRMMVTLGMAAFRLGKIWSAHQCLSEMCSGRVRELLAQGISTGRFSDKSAEQEKAEKRRQVPYHQHINLDLLEACHLSSAMLLEVPNMAAASVDGETGMSRRSRVISRTFRKHHDIYDRQVFTGPPEQTRDYVMRATKALMKGDWKVCADYLTEMDVWKLVPGDGADKKIKVMLLEKIKLEALRTYLFAYSSQYDSLSLSQLCAMFEMTKNEVHSVVSKMMINRELDASWDQPTETIVLRKMEPSSLQVMALQFAEKASSLVEANERLLDATSGAYGYKERDDNWKGDYGNRGYQQRGPRQGGRGGGGQRHRGGRRNY